jgi:hypothetical protein
MTDAWGVEKLNFRGPRDLVLRAMPLIALAAAAYSVALSIGALSVAGD